ncbi:MAG TPA: hypothetical protein VJJ98_01740 [Sedimentisphaerales bacterium]|nr:hypothetical protein [Sedimentisphaerales bacterium]
MNSGDDSLIRQYKWHIVIVCAVLAVVVLLMLTTDLFEPSETSTFRQLLLMLGGLMFLVALLTMLSRVFKILDALRENSAKLEGVAGALEKISTGLAQINHSTRVSETAKSIAFRDADRLSLRQAVFEKLQMQDFDGAKTVIDEIARRPEYSDLAEDLRQQAEKYRTATGQERTNQMIAHIDKLVDDCQWIQASNQIEELIKASPDSDRAKLMRQNLLDKKEERKRILLAAWDDAVHQQETDRSLEILKELDHYLTPNEALALQETAKDVFRAKLHNLGDQFSLLITEKHWNSALQIGQQIVDDFPNSKMAEEIRTKMDVLRQNVQMQNS